MTAYYATRGFVLHKSRKDRKSRVVQTELQDCATKSRNREVDSKIVRRLHTLDGALAYTGRHVEGIRRSAEAIGPYRGVGISGCGRYVGRRVPCFGTPAHPRAGGFRFGYADSVGAYARVGFPGIVDRAYVDQPYGWFHHDAAARYRQFSSAGWFRTSGRSVLPGGRAAYGNVLHQSRARCGAQADRFRRAFAAYVGRGSCDCHAASGMVVGEERFQFVGIAFRGWSRPKYLDEPERATIGCGMAEFPSYLAWQRVLRVSSWRQFVPLTFC